MVKDRFRFWYTSAVQVTTMERSLSPVQPITSFKNESGAWFCLNSPRIYKLAAGDPRRWSLVERRRSERAPGPVFRAWGRPWGSPGVPDRTNACGAASRSRGYPARARGPNGGTTAAFSSLASLRICYQKVTKMKKRGRRRVEGSPEGVLSRAEGVGRRPWVFRWSLG
jgi:hypothetical protein